MEEKKKFKVSHNNEPEVIIEAANEADAIKERLKQLSLESTTHPIRAWPAEMGNNG